MTSRPLHRPGDIEPRTQWPPPDVDDEPGFVADVAWTSARLVLTIVFLACALALGLTVGADLLIRMVTG